MLNVKLEGNHAIIDVRELIKSGKHPRNKIFDYVKQAPVGTLFDIHLPHQAPPLLGGLEDLGMNVTVDEIELGHYRMRAVKLTEM